MGVFPMEQTQNYGGQSAAQGTVDRVAVKEVRGYVERMERLVQQRANINSEMSSLREEIKGAGYDAKQINNIVKIRANEEKLKADYQTLETYARAIGIDLFSSAPDAGEAVNDVADPEGKWQ